MASLLLLFAGTALGYIINAISFFLFEPWTLTLQERMALRPGRVGRLMDLCFGVGDLPIVIEARRAHEAARAAGASATGSPPTRFGWLAIGEAAGTFLVIARPKNPDVLELQNARTLASMTRGLAFAAPVVAAIVVRAPIGWATVAIVFAAGATSLCLLILTAAVGAYCDLVSVLQ